MMTFDEAYKTVIGFAKPGPSVVNRLTDAMGRTLSRDYEAVWDMPRFDNSAVDGYAVSQEDTGRDQVRLHIAGRVGAGHDASTISVEPGSTVEIMTGAGIPQGTAGIAMREDVLADGDTAVVRSAIEPGRHIRRQGSEFQKGEVVVAAGTVVTPPVVSALASWGIEWCEVMRPPKVGILVTGTELAEPGQELSPGQIYESNSRGLLAALAGLGIEAKIGRCVDDAAETKAVLAHLLEECDVLVSSGGVSVGDLDFVRGALCALDFETVVPRVAMKPGKPFVFATRTDGKVAFGLPGNPMSTLVTYSVFVHPYLVKSMGWPEPAPFEAELEHGLENPGDRYEFVPATTSRLGPGLRVNPAPTVGSYSIAGLRDTDCLIDCPPGSSLAAGSKVQGRWLPWSKPR